jgi:hypothetical protein
MWLSEMNRKVTQLRSQLKNHRRSIFSILSFMQHPGSEIEAINYKDVQLLVDGSPEAILQFVNSDMEDRHEQWNLKRQIEELSEIMDLSEKFEKKQRKVVKSAKIHAYKTTKDGMESSLSRARNQVSKPLAKDEFGINEFDFQVSQHGSRGDRTMRKVLEPTPTQSPGFDEYSPKIDIFSSRDSVNPETKNFEEVGYGNSKSPLT